MSKAIHKSVAVHGDFGQGWYVVDYRTCSSIVTSEL